jgi:patatin-like phospholipase/acyl hydrolase
MAAPAHQRPGKKKLLSLDGGGVRGISSLIILQRILEKVAEIEGDGSEEDLEAFAGSSANSKCAQQQERLPIDYFDLAGGASTGGLIALMLFRLGLSTSAAIKAYEDLAKTVFAVKIGCININKIPVVGKTISSLWLAFKAMVSTQFAAAPLVKAIDKAIKESSNGDDCQKGGKAPLLLTTPDRRGKVSASPLLSISHLTC